MHLMSNLWERYSSFSYKNLENWHSEFSQEVQCYSANKKLDSEFKVFRNTSTPIFLPQWYGGYKTKNLYTNIKWFMGSNW